MESDKCRTILTEMSEGMHMKDQRVVKNRTKVLRNIDRGIENWMKHHSVQDMRDIVFEMYNRGEDISYMVDLVHQMDDMVRATHLVSDDNVTAFAEYDILTYVEEVEQEYAIA